MIKYNSNIPRFYTAYFSRVLTLVFIFPVLLFHNLYAQGSKNVFLLDHWTKPGLSVTIDNAVFNDVWGFTLNGTDYAAMGSTDGTHVLEITQEGKIIERAFIPGAAQGPNVTNRDVFEYQGYLYAICDNGYSTMQVIDLHYLPDSVSVVYDQDLPIQRAHSNFVDTATAKLYICGPKSTLNGDHALDIFSLSDPVNPALLGSFDVINYVHDCFVRNDTAWLNCGYDGVYVVDFSDVNFPVILGTLDVYPELGYNHSGWLSEDAQHYVFTDETQGKRIKYCDVSDPNDIQVLSLFNSGSDALTIAHNPMLINNYVYVSHYYDGLQIFDVVDPLNVQRVGWYDTHPEDENLYSGAWGVFVFKHNSRILISDRQAGLFVFEFNPPPRINTDLSAGMFPNPASSNSWFWLNNSRKLTYNFTAFNLAGETVYESQFTGNNHEINVADWPAGVYLYRVTGTESDYLFNGKMLVIHP